MMVKVLVDTLTKTVPDPRAKTVLARLSDIKAMALIIRLVDTLGEMGAVLLADISKYVDTDTLLERLHYNLVETEVQTLGDIPSDVKFKAMGMLHSRFQWWRRRTNGSNSNIGKDRSTLRHTCKSMDKSTKKHAARCCRIGEF